MKKIIIDIYGGDNGPEAIINGALAVLAERKDIGMVFAGEKRLVERIASSQKADLSRISFIDTKTFITNHDNPKNIFRGFDGTSLVLSLEEAKINDEVLGLLSCGNTGAVLIGSIFRLGLITGVSFPSLASALPLPGIGGFVCLLDCGAMVDCKPENLKEFALFGSSYMECAYGIKNPRVGLLNVGTEEGKGNELAKAAYPLIKALPINFTGNMEGCDLLGGKFDVCVADGFSGNVLLKNCEAVGLTAHGFAERLSSESNDRRVKEALTMLSASLYADFAYNDLGCSILLGTKKIVAKPHGKASEKTIISSLRQFLSLSDGDFVNKLTASLKRKELKS